MNTHTHTHTHRVVPRELSACRRSVLIGEMTLKQKFLSVSVTCAGFTLHRFRLRDMGTLTFAVDCRGMYTQEKMIQVNGCLHKLTHTMYMHAYIFQCMVPILYALYGKENRL